MQLWLQQWITNYVHGDPAHASEEEGERPLAGAEVIIEDVEGNPGYYNASSCSGRSTTSWKLTVSLRLVSKLPSQTQ